MGHCRGGGCFYINYNSCDLRASEGFMLTAGFMKKVSSSSPSAKLCLPGHFGLEAVVDGDSAAVVQLDAQRLQP